MRFNQWHSRMNREKKGAYVGEKHYGARGGRKGFNAQGGVHCKTCFQKDLEIDRLREELRLLKLRLKGREKAALTQGVFGNSTPSSQIPIKESSLEENRKRKGGAQLGHPGHGRSAMIPDHDSEVVRELSAPDVCPECDVRLHAQGESCRTLVDVTPMKAKRVLYRCKRGRCPQCFRSFTKKPQALAKTLYGNELVAQAAVLHYVQGVSLGKTLDIFGPEVTQGGLIQAFHRLGKLCEKALPRLVDSYRRSAVKHADETGWRTDGQGGYAWVFCSPQVTLFQFRETRAAKVAHHILGKQRLPGVLVVDRYNAYNRVNCEIQYCYAHLLREAEKLADEFSLDKEVVLFSDRLCGHLSEAMRLRGQEISDNEYYERAAQIKAQIQKLMRVPARHGGILNLQSIFIRKEHRLYHWVKDRRVPPDNNAAEREIRPTVIARKVSYGSQSERGARTRSQIMSVLYTARKRLKDGRPVEDWLKSALDQITHNPGLEFVSLLPPEDQNVNCR
jgi:transposase